MAAIRAKDTKPEMIVRRGLHSRGLRYRLHLKGLPGKPDLVFPGHKVALFVHGCFWHAHEGCSYFKLPKTDTAKWSTKLLGNRARDARDHAALGKLGWRVIVIWECQLKGRKPAEVGRMLDEVAAEIRA